MLLHILRHSLTKYNEFGKTNGQTIEDPLSDEGVRRAHEFAKALTLKVDIIYTADLLRTRQTAEIVQLYTKANIIQTSELREVHLGSLTGLSWEEMTEKVGRDILAEYKAQQYDFRPYGGESFEDIRKRVDMFIERVKKDDVGKTVLAITSGGIVRYFQYKYEGQTGQKVLPNLGIAEFEV